MIPQVESNGVVAVVRHSDKFVLIKKFNQGYVYRFPMRFGKNGLGSKENVMKELIGIENSIITQLFEISADSRILDSKI